MSRAIALLTACAALAAGEAWTPRPGIAVQPDGRVAAGGLTLELNHYDDGWRRTGPPQAVAGARGAVRDGTWTLAADWALSEGAAKLAQSVRPLDGPAVRIEAALRDMGPTRAFALTATLPGDAYRGGELRIDGQALALPAQSPQPHLRPTAPAKLVSIPLTGGTWLDLSGDLSVLVQDNRTWNSDSFTVRLHADAQGRVAADARLRQARIAPLPLGDAAATPLSDEVAGDGAGGWTDQGENDLRMLPAGDLDAAGVPFRIAGAAVVLAGEHVANRPRSAEVALPEGRRGEMLYLLHAAAWAPRGATAVGRVHLRFSDGSAEEREIVSGRDVADWWNPPERLPNAALGWTGVNPRAQVGLFVSRLPLPPAKDLAAVGLEVVGGAVWMVAGLSLGDAAAMPAIPPDVLAAGARWKAGAAPWEVDPGSALDLAAMNPGPVPGRLLQRGPRFELESAPGVPVRLLGANLCFSANYPTHAVADRMAAAFRAMGHNSVRIHHHDGALVPKDGDGSVLDRENADRLDYLFAACKKAGLWITTDVYVSRRIPAGAIPELPGESFGQEMKALVPLLPSAMENWKRYATVFLTRRNPYTGLAWGEDPALVTLSLMNEDNLHSWLERNPVVKRLYDERFAAWIAAQPEEQRSGEARRRAHARWLQGLQRASCDAMRAHVRSLGFQVPTTSANMQADWWSLALRGGFDFVDNHAYHDHPGFPERPWSLPYSYRQRNPVEELIRVPAGLAQSRLHDRPFTLTEVNYCAPNRFRHAYAPGVAAVAGLQAWDGVWRFAFSHDLRSIEQADDRMAGFDLVHDPISLLGERAMALLYRRGDIAPAPWAAVLAYDPAVAGEQIGKGPDRSIASLALHARVACLPADLAAGPLPADVRCLLQDADGGAAPAGALPVLPLGQELPKALVDAGLARSGDVDFAGRRVRSAGGQIAVDGAAGTLTIATARSVAAVLPGGAAAELSGVAIANADADPATIIVAALDDAALADSKRILVLHLTDAANTGMRFASRTHTLLQDWGKAPVLIRDGAASIRLPGGGGTAYALDMRGARREEVALADGALQAAVARAWGPCLAWEIVRQ